MYKSERRRHRNRALAYFLKDINCLEGDVEKVLDHTSVSVQFWSIAVARIGMFLAAKGISGGELTGPPGGTVYPIYGYLWSQ